MELYDKILFLNSEVWLTDIFTNTRQVISQPQINRWKAICPRNISKNITVFTPILVPLREKNRFLKRLNDVYNYRIINRFSKKPYLLILNDPRRFPAEITKRLIAGSSLTIFDWSDDFAEFSNSAKEKEVCDSICQYYCRNSDVVLTINDALAVKAKSFNRNVHTIRNATNFFTFQSPSNQVSVPRKIKKLKKPVVGYVGWLNGLRLDLDLILYCVQKRPDWQFVFMGPESDKDSLGKQIPKMPNVHVWPPVSYSKYTAYLTAFDVCILPNKLNAHTRGNDPIKIYDYLASGNPVVATKSAGTGRFQDVLSLAEDKCQFLEYLDRAVVEDSNEASEARREVALAHSWQERIQEVTSIIKGFI